MCAFGVAAGRGARQDESAVVVEACSRLMSRAAAGDQTAFAAVYDRLVSPVYAMAQSVIRDEGWAQRATSDAFLELWRTAATCPDGNDEALAWAMGVAARHIAEKSVVSVDQMPAGAAVADGPGAPRIDMRGTFWSLSVAQRECLLLAVHGWLSVGQAAQVLGRRPDVVVSLLRDALVQLRRGPAPAWFRPGTQDQNV